jgi:hypothetical protein
MGWRITLVFFGSLSLFLSHLLLIFFFVQPSSYALGQVVSTRLAIVSQSSQWEAALCTSKMLQRYFTKSFDACIAL